jgi:hypothetical protein
MVEESEIPALFSSAIMTWLPPRIGVFVGHWGDMFIIRIVLSWYVIPENLDFTPESLVQIWKRRWLGSGHWESRFNFEKAWSSHRSTSTFAHPRPYSSDRDSVLQTWVFLLKLTNIRFLVFFDRVLTHTHPLPSITADISRSAWVYE